MFIKLSKCNELQECDECGIEERVEISEDRESLISTCPRCEIEICFECLNAHENSHLNIKPVELDSSSIELEN